MQKTPLGLPNGIYFVSGKALAAGDGSEKCPQLVPTASALSLTSATFGGKVDIARFSPEPS